MIKPFGSALNRGPVQQTICPLGSTPNPPLDVSHREPPLWLCHQICAAQTSGLRLINNDSPEKQFFILLHLSSLGSIEFQWALNAGQWPRKIIFIFYQRRRRGTCTAESLLSSTPCCLKQRYSPLFCLNTATSSKKRCAVHSRMCV